jgi:hypothetical protein
MTTQDRRYVRLATLPERAALVPPLPAQQARFRATVARERMSYVEHVARHRVARHNAVVRQQQSLRTAYAVG